MTGICRRVWVRGEVDGPGWYHTCRWRCVAFVLVLVGAAKLYVPRGSRLIDHSTRCRGLFIIDSKASSVPEEG